MQKLIKSFNQHFVIETLKKAQPKWPRVDGNIWEMRKSLQNLLLNKYIFHRLVEITMVVEFRQCFGPFFPTTEISCWSTIRLRKQKYVFHVCLQPAYLAYNSHIEFEVLVYRIVLSFQQEIVFWPITASLNCMFLSAKCTWICFYFSIQA